MKLLRSALAVIASASLIACSGNTVQLPENSGAAELPGGVLDTSPIGEEASRAAALGNPGGSLVRYIVVLKTGTTSAQRNSLAATLTVPPTHTYSTVFKGFAGPMSANEVQSLRNNPLVQIVQLDTWNRLAGVTPGAAVNYQSGQQLEQAGGSPASTAMGSPQQTSWGYSHIGAHLNTGPLGQGVSVAIIDTGCDLTHPDLVGGYLTTGSTLVSFNGIYPSRPGDDDHGHGTHVAGIVGARDNNLDSVGVAPNCNLIPVKVLSDSGWGLSSWIIMGIDWCAQEAATYNIKVANMSLGGGGTDAAMEAAITSATDNFDVTFVVAAGNNYFDCVNFHPASFARVITVSSMAQSNVFSSFSNFGTGLDGVEIIAPGSAIFATYKKGRTATLSGTSMASPHMAGACALWFDDHSGGRDDVLAALIAEGVPGPLGGWPDDPNTAGNRPDPDGEGEPMVFCENL